MHHNFSEKKIPKTILSEVNYTTFHCYYLPVNTYTRRERNDNGYERRRWRTLHILL